jgi:D-mannonate dehydratase
MFPYAHKIAEASSSNIKIVKFSFSASTHDTRTHFTYGGEGGNAVSASGKESHKQFSWRDGEERRKRRKSSGSRDEEMMVGG